MNRKPQPRRSTRNCCGVRHERKDRHRVDRSHVRRETGMSFGVNPITGRPGPAPTPPRDGDKKQARQRINVLVRTGRLAHPNTMPCVDCGHVWTHGERRHEYDHHLGYGAAHHLDVQVVCTICQRARSMRRGEISVVKLRRAAQVRSAQRKTHCAQGHPMSRFPDGKWRCRDCRNAYHRRRRRGT